MTTLQRVIKYIAMGFAIFLTVVIVSSILTSLLFVLNLFDGNKKTTNTINTFENVLISEIKYLEIDINAGLLIIKSGEDLSLESTTSDDSKIEVTDDGTLYIKQSSFSFNGIFKSKNSDNTFILTLPKDFLFEEANIELGAGKIDVSGFTTSSLDIDLGVGEIIIEDIDTDECIVNLGIGSIKFDAIINELAKFDNGIGDIRVVLPLLETDYNYNANTGIGSTKLNNSSISTTNNASNIDITASCGIGSIDIYTDN